MWTSENWQHSKTRKRRNKPKHTLTRRDKKSHATKVWRPGMPNRLSHQSCKKTFSIESCNTLATLKIRPFLKALLQQLFRKLWPLPTIYTVYCILFISIFLDIFKYVSNFYKVDFILVVFCMMCWWYSVVIFLLLSSCLLKMLVLLLFCIHLSFLTEIIKVIAHKNASRQARNPSTVT